MVYKCEYCGGLELDSFSQLRQHVITVVHMRNKKSRELSAKCLKERLDFNKNRPEDFHKLLEVCEFNKREDIEMRHDFFNINDDRQASIAKGLIDVLLSEIIQFRIMQLPQEMREPFKTCILESENKKSNDDPS